MTSRRVGRWTVLLSVLVAAAIAPLSSAYKGHDNDRDVNAVLAAYPALAGTAVDSCATCHRAGEVKDPATPNRTRSENHCDFCHAVFVRGGQDVKETLNRYGRAYLAAGRHAAAVKAIAGKDADGDGFGNEAEFKAGTDPGDPASNPSAAVAPSRTLALSALRALAPLLDTTVFLNSTKSRSGDTYSDYRGHALWDVLRAVGVAPGATAVDVMAADGYERTFTLEELKRSWPQGVLAAGLGKTDIGECGWVSVGSRRAEPGKALPAVPVLLALEENGAPLDAARVDAASGRLQGKGPARLVAPQFRISPPDLPQTAASSCAGKVPPAHRFHDEYDHNAGASVNAVVAVRVKPLPRGTRDVDWVSSAARLLAERQILFFGALQGGAGAPGAPAR